MLARLFLYTGIHRNARNDRDGAKRNRGYACIRRNPQRNGDFTIDELEKSRKINTFRDFLVSEFRTDFFRQSVVVCHNLIGFIC